MRHHHSRHLFFGLRSIQQRRGATRYLPSRRAKRPPIQSSGYRHAKVSTRVFLWLGSNLPIRRSGRSIFSRPKPIDLNAPRANRLDIDLSDEEAEIGFEPSSVEFDADWDSAPRVRAPQPPRNAPNPSQPTQGNTWTGGN